MVLQTQADGGPPASLFGYAEPGEEVLVNMTIASVLTQYHTLADAVTGRWSVVVAPPQGTDPAPSSGVDFSLAAASSTTPTLILNASFGEVILCNGQSNQVLSVAAASNPVGRSTPPSPQVQHTLWPDIVLFSVVSTNSSTPTRDLPPYINRTASPPCTWGYVANMTPPHQGLVCQQWQVAAPGVTDFFSAQCFYTAYHLKLSGAIPPGRKVGLIQSAYSGTMMELWVPPEALLGCPAKTGGGGATAAPAPAAAVAAAAGGGSAPWIPGCVGANTTSCLWNDMVYPLVGLGLRAVVHNQIESNMGDSFEYYACVFQNMVASWRARWGIGDFPWITTGLGDQGFSPDGGGKNVGFPAYVATPRDGQAAILPGRYPGGVSRTRGGWLVSTYDLGDRVGNPNGVWDVHSRFKGEVGRRVALVFSNATGLGSSPVGGAQEVDWSGPVALSPARWVGGSIALTWRTAAGLRSSSSSSSSSSSATGSGGASGGVYANWTQDSWEGCDGSKAQDVFQVASWVAGANFTHSGPWVNTTFQWQEATATVLLSPVEAAPPGEPWLVVRYAASLWPQCAFYSSSNAVPAMPFSDLAIEQQR